MAGILFVYVLNYVTEQHVGVMPVKWMILIAVMMTFVKYIKYVFGFFSSRTNVHGFRHWWTFSHCSAIRVVFFIYVSTKTFTYF